MKRLRGIPFLFLIPVLLGGDVPDEGDGDPRPVWQIVNLHSHMHCRYYALDDGKYTPEVDHKKFEDAGFDHNVHTIHALGYGAYVPEDTDWSTVERWTARKQGTYEEANAEWWKLRAYEGTIRLKMNHSLGVEAGVLNGPNYDSIERNLNHVGGIGISHVVPSGMPLKTTLGWIHALGGINIINHPGPPSSGHWEKDYWERPGIREQVDAIEVYNGGGATFTIYYENTYLKSIADLGLRIAAVTGCDTHGRPFERRIEYTYVQSKTAEIQDIVDAVRNRRTLVALGLRDLKPVVRHLGEVVPHGKVGLSLDLGRTVDRIELWKGRERIRVWEKTPIADFQETLEQPAVYHWRFSDGEKGLRRGITSGIWYDPAPRNLPDLAFGEGKGVVVRNQGSAPAPAFVVRAGAQSFDCPALAPGESHAIEVAFEKRTYVEIDAASEKPEIDDDRVEESDERNNTRFFPAD